MIVKRPKDLEAYKKEIKEWVLTEGQVLSEQIEATRHFDDAAIRKILQPKGLLRLTGPVEWGGWNLGMTDYLPILEIMSAAQANIRGMVHQAARSWEIIYKYGNEEQKKKWLPRLVTGLGTRCIAMTEPDAGTGADIKTTAVKKGNKLVINGNKHFASWANIAQPLMTWAYTDKSKGRHGISCIIIGDMKEDPIPAGIAMKNLPPMMGNTDAYHGVVNFRNAEVPLENLLGKEGEGLDMFLSFIAISRVCIATQCLGIAQRCLDLAVDFSKKRVTFGKPIAHRQAVQTMLADMAIDVHALRTMIMDAARKIDAGTASVAECSMCKLFGIDAVRRVSDNALLVHGGIGFTRVYTVERLYRDARSLWMEEGTPSIHRLVVARALLGDKDT